MPLWKVKGHTTVSWEFEVEAPSSEMAEELALDMAQTPDIDENHEWEEPEVDVDPVRIAEDGEEDE